MANNEKDKIYGDFAKYYDLMYDAKNYHSECDYIERILETLGARPKSMLDLGCGTGTHDMHFLSGNIDTIYGVDISEGMLYHADLKKNNAASGKKIEFLQHDIRTLDLKRKLDLVVSLFNVITYFNSNEDVTSVMETARKHLDKGGLFIFDFWYGPAVLTLTPSVRFKKFDLETVNILRVAEPEADYENNTVNLKYSIFAYDKQNNRQEEIVELHKVRYFFKPELEYLLKNSGFEMVQLEEMGSGNKIGVNTWNVCCVARAI